MSTHYEVSRSIIRRYMADFSGMTTPPKTSKGGWYAYVARDTGKAWIAETKTWITPLQRLRVKAETLPTCITEAFARGAEVDFWCLTKPEQFDVANLIEEMVEYDFLETRKEIILDTPGTLYSIRHDRTHAYFLVKNRRTDMNEHDVLAQYLKRLEQTGSLKVPSRANVNLQQFITDNVNDILGKKGFTAVPVAKFENLADASNLIAGYVMDSRYGHCLNRVI